MFDLTGKAAVVTAGGSGIGEATVRRFLAASARVLILDVADAAAKAEEWGCS
jgi:NAD(P)-dependent dehydrogenase (short-subunit alcohol dehydrogenase family)